MRRAARIDNVHTEIVDALRKMGASVQSLAGIGHGCPDLLVGYQGRDYVIEVKTKKGTLTEAELEWATAWKGRHRILRSVEDVVRWITETRVEIWKEGT